MPPMRLAGTTLFVAALAIAVGVPTVLAQEGDDPIPGFGMLIAFVALFVALLIAKAKQRQYLDGSN